MIRKYLVIFLIITGILNLVPSGCLCLDETGEKSTNPVSRQSGFWNNFKQTIKKIDNKIFIAVNQSVKSKLVDYIMIVLTMLGNGWVIVPLMGLILFLHNRVTFKSNLIIFVVVLLCGGIVIQALKFLFDKARPLKQLQDLIAVNQVQVRVLLQPLKERGLPSGHTQAVFTAAVFLGKKIKKFVWLFFIVAFFSGISRIYVGAHYFSDVIGGIIVGIAGAEFFYWVIQQFIFEKIKKNRVDTLTR